MKINEIWFLIIMLSICIEIVVEDTIIFAKQLIAKRLFCHNIFVPM